MYTITVTQWEKDNNDWSVTEEGGELYACNVVFTPIIPGKLYKARITY